LQYRTFGNTGVSLSALGFGAMRLPKDEDEAVRIIQRSFELGVNYLDTAVIYGDSEKICAKALKGWRDKVWISTKNPLWGEEYKEDGWWARLEQSLEKMEVDCIDFYQSIHGLTWEQYEGFLKSRGGMDMIHKAMDQGMIKYNCCSCHDKPENMMKLIDTGEFSGMTVQYNLLDRVNEEAIAYAHEKGMGVIIMGPVGGGRLAGPGLTLKDKIPGGVKTSAELALRFVLSNPNVTCAISGMSNMEQVIENAEIASRKDMLSAGEKQAIEAALEENKKLMDLYCTGCKYCMPCPQNINIAANLRYMNNHRVWGLTENAKSGYNSLSNPEAPDWGKKAEECTQCGECEPKCPQNIKIVEQLKEVAKVLGSA